MAHTIVRVDCDTITIENTDVVNDMTYAVSELQDDKTFLEIVAATTILAGATETYNFPNDGVFQLTTVENGPVTTNYPYVIDCAVRTCIKNLINEIMFALSPCDCECLDYTSPKHYAYTNIKLVWYTYLASLNTQYVDNETYTALDPHDLEDLYFISQMITKLTDLCACADELDDTDCGC